MLDTRALSSSKQTISVYTRHKLTCPRSGQPHYRACKCNKYLYLLRNGKSTTVSAKTRTWSVAEDKAAVIRDAWDPVKLKLKQLESREAARDFEAVTIEAALERWIENVRSKDKSEATFSKYVTLAKQVNSWAHELGLTRLEQISPDNLDQWKCSWKHSANRLEDRIGKTTAARRLELVKRFLTYCRKMRWIEVDPALDIEAISPGESETLPLLGGRYEAVIDATFRYDEEMRPDDRFGQELRAIIELMRWTGLRISDALPVKRQVFSNNLLRVKLQKTQKWHTVVVPDQVILALSALSNRSTCDPIYFFWSGTSKLKSLTGQWQRKLARLNQFLSLKDDEGNPMRFHSHQLRDTFAVSHLLSGTSMEDVSHMLAHESVRVTEKYYAPWVPERQALLERKMREGLQRMGVPVSFVAATSGDVPS